MNRRTRIVACAVVWWKMHRPDGWAESEHIDHYKINTSTDADGELAFAVAEWLRGTKPRRKKERA